MVAVATGFPANTTAAAAAIDCMCMSVSEKDISKRRSKHREVNMTVSACEEETMQR
jgi:hypothetical protein